MKAVVLHGYGGLDQLKFEDVPEPAPQAGEVLVKVAATSINPVDWKLRSGSLQQVMPLQLPAILGRDVAGTVERVGEGVRDFRPGDRVMGLVNQTYAQFLVAKAAELTKIPDKLDTQQAAALPLVTLTGAQLIEEGVQPQRGQTVLVTGAAGGVGRTAVFVAKQAGAVVIAGVRARQVEEAKTFGADRVVAIDAPDALQHIGQVDAIADTVGHDVILRLLPAIRKGGVLASVLGAPSEAEQAGLIARNVWAHPDAARLHELASDVRTGKLVIPIADRMPLADAARAQQRAEKGGIGKILLIP